MQTEFLANPTEQIGQREKRGCVGTTSKRQCVCAGEGFEEEGVLCGVGREDLTGREPSPRRLTNGCASAAAAKSPLSAHKRVDSVMPAP